MDHDKVAPEALAPVPVPVQGFAMHDLILIDRES